MEPEISGGCVRGEEVLKVVRGVSMNGLVMRAVLFLDSEGNWEPVEVM